MFMLNISLKSVWPMKLQLSLTTKNHYGGLLWYCKTQRPVNPMFDLKHFIDKFKPVTFTAGWQSNTFTNHFTSIGFLAHTHALHLSRKPLPELTCNKKSRFIWALKDFPFFSGTMKCFIWMQQFAYLHIPAVLTNSAQLSVNVLLERKSCEQKQTI